MDSNSFESLPQTLKEVNTRPLFVMRLAVRKLPIIGPTPALYRRIGRDGARRRE
jgi:hypothetical protein